MNAKSTNRDTQSLRRNTSADAQDPDYPVLDRMSACIETWKNTNDRRHLFLSCYATMTGNMVQAIKADEFRDPVWVKNLLERFADYYFEGLQRCECGVPDRPRVWDFTHRSTLQCDLHVIQYLLLGINAHINYDLVLTLEEILKDEWPGADESLKEKRKNDHHHVNTIIARTIDAVQDEIIEVHNPVMEILDKLMGRVDEYLLSRLIRRWRNDVWEEATSLLVLQNPDEREERRRMLEEKVMRLGKRIMLR